MIKALITLDAMLAGADLMGVLYNLHSGRIAPAIAEIVLAVALIVMVTILWRNAT